MLDVNELFAKYASVDPRDRRDAIWTMSEETLRYWADYQRERERARDYRGIPYLADDGFTFSPVGNQLFGIPIEVDDRLPYGVAQISADSPQERAMRRLAERGGVVKLIKTEPIKWDAPRAAPKPTLSALVRHWVKRIRER